MKHAEQMRRDAQSEPTLPVSCVVSLIPRGPWPRRDLCARDVVAEIEGVEQFDQIAANGGAVDRTEPSPDLHRHGVCIRNDEQIGSCHPSRQREDRARGWTGVVATCSRWFGSERQFRHSPHEMCSGRRCACLSRCHAHLRRSRRPRRRAVARGSCHTPGSVTSTQSADASRERGITVGPIFDWTDSVQEDF